MDDLGNDIVTCELHVSKLLCNSMKLFRLEEHLILALPDIRLKKWTNVKGLEVLRVRVVE